MGEVSIPGLSGVPDIPQRIPSEWKASYTNDGAMPVVEHGSISPVRLPGRNLVSDQISENFARVDRSTIPICAVRCCPHFRQQTGRRIPSLSRFGRIREAGGTQIFVTTSPPAADGCRLFCRGHSSFQTPGRQGLSVQVCCFRQQTDHAAQASVSFDSSVPCGGTMAVWLHIPPSIPLLSLS